LLRLIIFIILIIATKKTSAEIFKLLMPGSP
jgi:hypothetical protein